MLKQTHPTRWMFTVLGGLALIGLWQFVMTPSIHSNAITVTPVPLCTRADLAVAKTVNNATPNVGDLITYAITVTNKGPDNATGVRLTDVLPKGVTYVPPSNASQSTYANSLWTVGNLADNTNATLAITARVDNGACITTITNTAHSLTADQSDPDPTNNEASAVITVTGADLAVTKTVNNATPNAGEVITYTITVTNNGPYDATGVQLTDVLPTGVTFGCCTATQGTYTSTTGLWTVGDIGCGASDILNINAMVNNCAGVGTITNTTKILTPDPNPDNNEASAGIDPASAYCLYFPIIYDNYCYPPTATLTYPITWPITNNAELKTEYTPDGEYRILPKDRNVRYAWQLSGSFTDYEIEVDARWVSGTSTGKGYGIVFGLVNNDNYYLYQVNADQREYRLLLRSGGSWAPPLTNNGNNYGWVPSAAIKGGSLATNTLKVIRCGSQITLYVNSVYLETQMNGVITSGRVGLSVQCYSNGSVCIQEANALFDNYIFTCPCVEAAGIVNAESNPPAPIPSTDVPLGPD